MSQSLLKNINLTQDAIKNLKQWVESGKFRQKTEKTTSSKEELTAAPQNPVR